MSDDDGDNPFEEFDDAVGDREGDPFESLGDDSEDSTDEGSEHDTEPFAPGRPEPDIEKPMEGLDRQDRSQSGGRGTPADGAEDSTAERGLFPPEETDGVDRESPPSGDAATGSPNPAEESEMEFDVGQRDTADPTRTEFNTDVGRREGDPFDSFEDAFDEMDVDKLDPDVVWQDLASAESRGSVGDAQERTYADVSKHSYCEQCKHFSPPPNVSCGHEGTEIVEFLDMETVRVVDCPIVTEREELENDDGFGDA